MDLDSLLAQQAGLLTRSQAYRCGVSVGSLAWRLGHGWRLVLPGVISCTPGPVTPAQRLVAALLYAGPGSALAGATACDWHGIEAAGGDLRVHLLIPARRQLAGNCHLVIRRTQRPDVTCWVRGPLRVTGPVRSVADAARQAPDAAARAIVIEAVQRRMVRVSDLRHELEAGPRVGSRRLRAALRDAEAGAWSIPELELLRALATSTVLPEVWANPLLTAGDGTRLPTPDVWVDDVALAVQVHSHRYHASGPDWDATVMSDGVFAEYGVALVAVTPGRITHDPAGVLARIERAYRAAQCRPRPNVVAVRQLVA